VFGRGGDSLAGTPVHALLHATSGASHFQLNPLSGATNSTCAVAAPFFAGEVLVEMVVMVSFHLGPEHPPAPLASLFLGDRRREKLSTQEQLPLVFHLCA
jgi:hypothetical protein